MLKDDFVHIEDILTQMIDTHTQGDLMYKETHFVSGERFGKKKQKNKTKRKIQSKSWLLHNCPMLMLLSSDMVVS